MRRTLLSAALLAGTVMAVGGGSVVASVPRVDTYLVVLDASPTSAAVAADELSTDHGGHVDDVFDRALDGFTLTATPAQAAALRQDPRVAYVEPDRAVTIDAQATPTGIGRTGAGANSALHIDGVDGVRVQADVAVLDTGVDLQHPDLNVAGGVDCLVVAGCVPGGDDDNLHGTHVAGIIGALDNGIGVVGVAPGVRLWAVKVLDSTGGGTVSSVIRGLDWVATNAATIEVVNLSLGVNGFSQALHDAVQAVVDRGVAVVAAAGNSHVSAAGVSPASFDNVLTVSALADFDGLTGGVGAPTCTADQDDTLADFSNFGPIDLAAPGVCINSTLPIERGSYGLLSGTSMAGPHVTGALALLAQTANSATAADVSAMYRQVIDAGRDDWTDDSGDGVKEPRLDLSSPALFAIGPPPTCAAISSVGLLGAWRGEQSLAAAAGPAATGSVDYAFGESGRAFRLGPSSTVNIPGMGTATSGVTVAAWIRPIDTLGAQAVISRWNDIDEHGRSYRLLVLPGGVVEWSTDDTSTRRPVVVRAASTTLFDGSFHHLAATWDPTRIDIYLDGVALASAPSQGGQLEVNPATDTRIGSQFGPGDPLRYSGLLDEPTVWGRALTATEIQAIRSAGPAGIC